MVDNFYLVFLMVLTSSIYFIPQLHSGLSPFLSDLRLYLASALWAAGNRMKLNVLCWSTLKCLSLAGFLNYERRCHGGNLFWKSRIDLHPCCILCQGFRKVKHSRWVRIIERGHSFLQTRILDDIYSPTGTISTVK